MRKILLFCLLVVSFSVSAKDFQLSTKEQKLLDPFIGVYAPVDTPCKHEFSMSAPYFLYIEQKNAVATLNLNSSGVSVKIRHVKKSDEGIEIQGISDADDTIGEETVNILNNVGKNIRLDDMEVMRFCHK